MSLFLFAFEEERRERGEGIEGDVYLGGVNNSIGGLRLGRKAPNLLLGIDIVPAELVDQHLRPVLGIFVDRYELVINCVT